MKISKMFTVLAAVALLAGLASCSSDDNPVIPAGGSGIIVTPSIKIDGTTKVASATISGVTAEEKTAYLTAYATGWGNDATVTYSWEVTKNSDAVAPFGANENKQVSINLVSANSADLTEDKVVTVKVTATKVGATNVTMSTTYDVTIVKNATGKPALEFLHFAPKGTYYQTPTGASTYVYKVAGDEEAVTPQGNVRFPARVPVYNGIPAYDIGTANYVSEITFKIGDTTVAQFESHPTETSGKGSTYGHAKSVNKTAKDTVTTYASGYYKLSDTVKTTDINEFTTVKVAPGKKVKVTLTYTKENYDNFKYGSDAVTNGVKVIDDLYAGFAYETLVVAAKKGEDNKAGEDLKANAARSEDITDAAISTTASKFTITIPYATGTIADKVWYIVWEN